MALRHGTTAVAQAYLQYLYSPEGQDIIARNYYLPRDPAWRAIASTFGKTGTPCDHCGLRRLGQAQPTDFDDGGTFVTSTLPEPNSSEMYPLPEHRGYIVFEFAHTGAGRGLLAVPKYGT